MTNGGDAPVLRLDAGFAIIGVVFEDAHVLERDQATRDEAVKFWEEFIDLVLAVDDFDDELQVFG